MKVEFRRNHTAPPRGFNLRRRAILLTFVVFCLVALLFSANFQLNSPKATAVIHISFLDNGLYLIQNDTTNYDYFASVLKKHVASLRKQAGSIELQLLLPKEKVFGQVSDILQVANAFEGVKMRLISQRD